MRFNSAGRPGPVDNAPSDLAWRVIGLVNIYRLLIAGGLFVASQLEPARELLIFWQATPMSVVSAVYFLTGVGLVAMRKLAFASLRMLALVHALIDSVAIAWILWASGGTQGGLGILLLLPIGAMALLAATRDAFFMAATATVAVLVQQVAWNPVVGDTGGGYFHAGVLGAVIFLAALSVRLLANRLQELDLANLAQLSQYIVQHLRESILVVDEQDRIRLINEPAADVLGNGHALPDALLGECSPRLLFLLSAWRQHGDSTGKGTFPAADGARLIQPHFAHLGTVRPGPVLIFLENTSLLAERVQQSKLASLGRLSASIAHEIRTPIGAMSHAGQLLAESPAIAAEDRRLTQIIRDNAERVSRIVENVLELSRRNTRRPERIDLGSWASGFWNEFCATQQINAAQLRIATATDEGHPIEIRVDPTQLHQVMWNLCQNALTHGQTAGLPNKPVEIRFGRIANSGRPFLEVADKGPGIDSDDMERVFEPFFTKAPSGTGLGLFLARELAEANGATLLHEAPAEGGSIFRLVFTDPGRWEE
jgi:two-component system, NtrC family, sensor histidine kinase PilS